MSAYDNPTLAFSCPPLLESLNLKLKCIIILLRPTIVLLFHYSGLLTFEGLRRMQQDNRGPYNVMAWMQIQQVEHQKIRNGNTCH